jgi:geranylgeranyl diphosphate synthase type II
MHEWMNPLLAMTERTIVSACLPSTDVTNACLEAMHLHLAAGGGRVRARICLQASNALGLSDGDAVRIAAVCELLHNASLVQDDLLDRSTLRRGAPCIWVTHGDSIAVCAGDLMLSAAYGLLAEIWQPGFIAQALRLIHRRTSEIILGQAAEGERKSEREATMAYYERLAQGKSASLLSLSLELPLLLSGHGSELETAHSAACDFAVAYQIADDLTDVAQDMREGSLNLVMLFMEQEGMTQDEAWHAAVNIAKEKLASSAAHAAKLPKNCSAAMLDHAGTLRHSLAEVANPSPPIAATLVSSQVTTLR